MSRWLMAMAVCGLAAALPVRGPAQQPPIPEALAPGYGPAPYGAPAPGYGPAPYGAPMMPPGGGPGPGGMGMMPGTPGMPNPPSEPSGAPSDQQEDPMTLTHLGPTAFENNNAHGPANWFFSIGSKAYMRQRPSSMPIGQADPGQTVTQTATVSDQVTFQNGQNVFTLPANVTATYQTQSFPDTGNGPGAGAPFIGDYHDLDPGLGWGLSGTFGYRYGDSSMEITGFFIPENGGGTLNIASNTLPIPVPVTGVSVVSTAAPTTMATSKIIGFGDLAGAISSQTNPGSVPGRLDLPFFNAPAGFEGDNGLWQQADLVHVSFRSSLGDVEANYRYWPSDLVQILVGLRYVDEKEDLQVFTDDDALLVGAPDPTKSALYRVVTENRLVLGQLGAQGEVPICKFMGLGAFATGGWGTNFLTSQVSLTRGDGLVGFDGTRHANAFGQAYEIGAFMNLYCGERCRVHVGYNAFWLIGVAEAVKQVDYDLTQTTGAVSNTGSVFFHGPQIEVQFIF